jgi:hypothetical protein
LIDQSSPLVLEILMTRVDLRGPAFKFGQFDKSALVQIDQTPTLEQRRLCAALKAAQLGGEEFVSGAGSLGAEGVFSCQEHVGPFKHRTHLCEDEVIQSIRPDVAFGATPLLASGADRIVIGTVVVTVIDLIACAHAMTAKAYRAGPALEQMT